MTSTSGARAVARGCGTRQKGGLYLEVGLSPNGQPIEFFLLDPPIPVPDGLELPKRGVALMEKDGVWHVVDWVGEMHYQNVADFIEEVRRFGLSRRAQKSLDFSKLGPGSRIILAHRKALITNVEDYRPVEDGPYACPKQIEAHCEGGRSCAGLHWSDLVEATVDESTGVATRTMPSFTYTGTAAPVGVTPHYVPAFFLSMPLSRIAVVRDPEGGTHQYATEAAAKCRLPVAITEQ